MIKILVLATICVAISTPALACRGTAQFPEAAVALAAADMSAETKKDLQEQLSEAEALHAQGHEIGNGSMMGKALMVLDEIKAQVRK